ncbi:superoxide dismutase family protein [Brachybacterium sacelli]
MVAAGALALSGCGSDQTQDEPAPAGEGDGTALATAQVQDGDGNEVGTAEFTEAEDGLRISVNLSDLEPGHHGLHVHEAGLCEPDSAAPDDPSETGDFLSAGGHIGAGEVEHPDHPGDLPSLLVNEDGTATMTFVTDRLSEEDLLDDDGAALMVHSGPDNFANIPERYAPDGPDDDTTGAGDAGDRAACGAIEAANG